MFFLGGVSSDDQILLPVERYSLVTREHEIVSKMPDDRGYFCACAFINKIYVIGGGDGKVTFDSCLQFDADKCEWKKTSKMNRAREAAACEVFEGIYNKFLFESFHLKNSR